MGLFYYSTLKGKHRHRAGKHLLENSSTTKDDSERISLTPQGGRHRLDYRTSLLFNTNGRGYRLRAD